MRRVSCGSQQEVQVITPDATSELDASLAVASTAQPVLAGFRIASNSKQAPITSSDACGMFIELMHD